MKVTVFGALRATSLAALCVGSLAVTGCRGMHGDKHCGHGDGKTAADKHCGGAEKSCSGDKKCGSGDKCCCGKK